jgi:hypothetical protein
LSTSAAAQPVTGSPQLRVSYIWRDEVMDDAVLTEPAPVTLGGTDKATFTTPPLGLPDNFAILRPGARGYVLTLGKGMGGRVRIGGEEMQVAQFVERGGASAEGVAGDFRAAPVSSGDWGVIHLDKSGTNSVFFQFVPAERPLPPATSDREALKPALAFAIILHAILLAVTYSFKDDGNSLVFPGRRGLLTDYFVKRPPPPEPPKKPPTPKLEKKKKKKKVAAAPKSNATKRKKGRSGGKGKKRATKLAKKRPLLARAPDRGLTSKKSRQVLDDLLKKDPLGDIRLPGKRTTRGDPGKGRGRGIGVGNDKRFGYGTRGDAKGKGRGGAGTSHADAKTSGKPLGTGKVRKGPSGTGGKGLAMRGVVRTGSASGSFGGLTRSEIDRVVKRRRGLIRACYQKVLNHSKIGGGKVVVTFRISGAGRVTSARIRSSGVRNSSVHDCMLSRIRRLRFPSKGGAGALVNYPFIFSSG